MVLLRRLEPGGSIRHPLGRGTARRPGRVHACGPEHAPYARFRIAINFPDLKMMGANSFMNIKCAPDAIERALKLAAWGSL